MLYLVKVFMFTETICIGKYWKMYWNWKMYWKILYFEGRLKYLKGMKCTSEMCVQDDKIKSGPNATTDCAITCSVHFRLYNEDPLVVDHVLKKITTLCLCQHVENGAA